MESLKVFAEAMFYLVIIVAFISLAYTLVWTALFYPITKKRKHEEAVAEANREYNKVQVEHATIIKAKETTNEQLKKILYTIHQKEKQLENLNKEIDSKVAEANKTTKKK